MSASNSWAAQKCGAIRDLRDLDASEDDDDDDDEV
jgi:hypothetical protein